MKKNAANFTTFRPFDRENFYARNFLQVSPYDPILVKRDAPGLFQGHRFITKRTEGILIQPKRLLLRVLSDYIVTLQKISFQ